MMLFLWNICGYCVGGAGWVGVISSSVQIESFRSRSRFCLSHSRQLREFKSKSLQSWKSPVRKMMKIMACSGLSNSTKERLHIDDIELLLHGLNYFPTEYQLMEISREIRFSNSHLTWEICQDIHVDDFCQMLQHCSKWIPKSECKIPQSGTK